ncbi:MAG: hypothetical protein WC777_04790 [Candidatus Gracilibacteria bacterium]|jgi:hypothetical protein
MKKFAPLFTLALGILLAWPIQAFALMTVGDRATEGNEDAYEVPAVAEGGYDEGDRYCVGATHEHTHYHTSTDTDTQEFWEVIHSFAIVFEDDFLETVDTDTNFLCTDGSGTYRTCNFDKEADLGEVIHTVYGGEWNGITVTYQVLNWIEGNPKGLLWEYGREDPEDIDLKPWLPSGDYFIEGISFELLDYDTDQIVTTTSWTKPEFYYIDPDAEHSIESNWHQTYPEEVDSYIEEVDPDEDHIFWYGLNGTAVTNFPACPPTEEELTCSKLVLNPGSVGLDNVFSDTDFEATVYANDGTVITDEVDVTYQAYNYDGAAASGDIRYGGSLNILNGNAGPVETGDTEVEYRDSMPGDRFTAFVSDYLGVSYEGTGLCEAEVEFPYCSDLLLLDPETLLFTVDETEVDLPIEVEAVASNGHPWPYDLTYSATDTDATFDGDTTPYTTTDWTIDSFQSDETGSVLVEAENDVAGVCRTGFTYVLTPQKPVCESLEVRVPDHTLTCEEMTEGGIEIRWESTMTDGTETPGPWRLTSSNPNGEFSRSAGGPSLGTGFYISAIKVVYYTGEPGDTIEIVDINQPYCSDTIESETCEGPNPVCEDLTLSGPYINNDDGSTTPIDLSDEEDLALLYEESTVCWNFALAVSDASYSGTLLVEGFTDPSETAYSGNLSVLELSTLRNEYGNPVSMGLSGAASYAGIICWENFEAKNVLSVSMIGEEAVCSQEVTLPPPPDEAPFCIDLQMDPDSYTMSAEDEDAGIIAVTIAVEASAPGWAGTLVVNRSGSGALFYTDGSPSEYGDGHLEIPVFGTDDTVIVFYRNGDAGDTVNSYIVSDSEACADAFSIDQTPPEGLYCVDLDLNEDTETVTVQGSDSDWTGTLVITEDGNGQLYYSDGSSSGYSDGHLEIPVSGTSSTVSYSYSGDDADIEAYIRGEAGECSDDYSLSPTPTPTPENVCEDIDFTDTDFEVDLTCEDIETEICVDRDENGDDERVIEVCYETAEGDRECEEMVFEFDEGEDQVCEEVSFEEVCEGAEIEVLEDNIVCEDLNITEAPEEKEVGSFEKFIYTFNFSSEKNSYSDEGVFFSHDEDRAFYTLAYEPSGDEDAITFTDEMWGSTLEGHKGDGSDSGGNIRLATSYSELVEGTSGATYDYNLITMMGFGDEQEENSDDLAAFVDSEEFRNNFMAYLPYIKMPGEESVRIEECDYDEEGNLETEEVCYDPDHSPTSTEDIVIENTGTVVEDYGDEAVIRIRYVGVITSGLNCGDSSDECLTEEFENNASVEVFDDTEELTAEAKLVVLCSYLMTQNAGDVYLEVSLEGGSDISCIFVEEDEATSSDYRNVDALIILEDTEPTEDDDDEDSASTVSTYSLATVSFCDDDDSNSIVGNLSSFVCEIVAKVSDLWASSTVETTTSNMISQATRNADTSQMASVSTYDSWEQMEKALTNNNNSSSNILYFDGSLSNEADPAMTLGGLTVPSGAWTIIVKNADLRLTKNIQYATVSNPGDYKNLPSVAFVVLGGDIYIEDGAQKLVGVYYTDQKFDGDERSAVDEQLTVDGSFYGNVQTLIQKAKYVGPPTIDGGGIVIRYDSRILLNTPPALSEYVDINTEKGVN